MKYISVCSGVEAATVAWHPLGWTPAAFSEIEAFPSAVLAHHYPHTPNLGDMTKFKDWNLDGIDLLVGGTPCQSFSVAGLRKGLDDPRGNLALTYCAILDRFKPKWFVWENVPGVLSSGEGRDFGSFLGAVAELGYGFAYRVLDAQYFGVAQRRRRVFVVGYLGDWRRAAAVLFERESMSGNPAPSRETRQEVAKCLTRGAGTRLDSETDTFIITDGMQGNMIGRADNAGPQGSGISEDVSFTLTKADQHAVAYSFDSLSSNSMKSSNPNSGCRVVDLAKTLDTTVPDPTKNQGGIGIVQSAPVGFAQNQRDEVRRLTPRECERLQGFPDDYTAIPWRGKPADQCPDGPRYKAMGNSMAVPVMNWIGARIALVDMLS